MRNPLPSDVLKYFNENYIVAYTNGKIYIYKKGDTSIGVFTNPPNIKLEDEKYSIDLERDDLVIWKENYVELYTVFEIYQFRSILMLQNQNPTKSAVEKFLENSIYK